MQNPFQLFNHPKFGQVRVAQIDGEIFFVGKDVAKALGYERPDMALKRHVDERDKRTLLVATFQCMKGTRGGQRRMTVIKESGLYALILSSHAPFAQEFKHWVTSEVLPSVIKTGSYTLAAFNATPAALPADDSKELNRLRKQLTITENFELAVVYILLMSDGTVKVGMTKDLSERIKQIQAQTGRNVLNFKSTPFMLIKDARELESALKEKFAAYKISGEYFDMRFVDACESI